MTNKSPLYILAKRLVFHLAFWSFIVLIYFISYSRLDKNLAWLLVTKDLFIVTSIFYFTSYVIIPKWLLKGKVILSIAWIFVIYSWWALLTYLTCVIIDIYFIPGPRLELYVKAVMSSGLIGIFNWIKLPFFLLDFIYLTALPIGLKVMQALVKQSYQKTVLERDNLALELAFLKTQINPHFLYNSLNNIHSMVDTNHPEAAESVAKLGNLMQYMLHDSNESYVTVNDEINFIENYLRLESLRLNRKVEIRKLIQIDSNDYVIVPLILFPIIENAFKHGPKNSNRNAWIDIQLIVKNETLVLQTSNSVNQMPKPKGYIGGIGLKNLRKRLEMNYVNRYDLKIEEQENNYTIKLKLNLRPI